MKARMAESVVIGVRARIRPGAMLQVLRVRANPAWVRFLIAVAASAVSLISAAVSLAREGKEPEPMAQ